MDVCDNSRMAKKGRRATEEERLRAVQLLEDGCSPELVADLLGVGRSSVSGWQKAYREGWAGGSVDEVRVGASDHSVGSADDATVCDDCGQ